MRAAITMLLTFAAAGCAPVERGARVESETARACFTSADVDNFRIASSQQVYVHSRLGGAFRLDTPPNCFDAASRALVVEPYVSVSERICSGDQARVRVLDASAAPKTCRPQVTGPITDSTVSGLPG